GVPPDVGGGSRSSSGKWEVTDVETARFLSENESLIQLYDPFPCRPLIVTCHIIYLMVKMTLRLPQCVTLSSRHQSTSGHQSLPLQRYEERRLLSFPDLITSRSIGWSVQFHKKNPSPGEKYATAIKTRITAIHYRSGLAEQLSRPRTGWEDVSHGCTERRRGDPTGDGGR